jgi:hypothetical protein
MFSHVMVGSNDIAQSKKFYDALFVAMGGKPGVEDAKGRLIYAHNGGRFMVSKPRTSTEAVVIGGGLDSPPPGGEVVMAAADVIQIKAGSFKRQMPGESSVCI